MLIAGAGLWPRAEGAGGAAAGAPVPIDSIPADSVLARVPVAAASPVARRDDRAPPTLEETTAAARALLQRSRADGDPRWAGRAAALLAPLRDLEEPPVGLLIVRAAVREHLHDFDGALADLRAATARAPGEPQGWLSRATLETLRGEYALARQSCAALVARVHPLTATTCVAAVDGMTGSAGLAYARVHEQVARAGGEVSPGELSFALTLLADLADRLGRPDDAERHLGRALALAPRDPAILAAIADLLLEEGRAREALALVAPHATIDGLLLRRAIAERMLGAPAAEASAGELRARFAGASARGDRTHLREEARAALDVAGDARAALALALENWDHQREPADVRLVVRAAARAGAPGAAPVSAWRARTGYEDARLP